MTYETKQEAEAALAAIKAERPYASGYAYEDFSRDLAGIPRRNGRWLLAVHDMTPPAERQRQIIALRLKSPKRAEPGKAPRGQMDAAHCPLFVAANEPKLI